MLRSSQSSPVGSTVNVSDLSSGLSIDRPVEPYTLVPLSSFHLQPSKLTGSLVTKLKGGRRHCYCFDLSPGCGYLVTIMRVNWMLRGRLYLAWSSQLQASGVIVSLAVEPTIKIVTIVLQPLDKFLVHTIACCCLLNSTYSLIY